MRCSLATGCLGKTTGKDSRVPSEDTPHRRGPWVLPIIPKGHNSLNWSHWRNKKREADRWKLAVKAIPRGPCHSPYVRVRLEILVYRKQLQDPDNAVASCKYLVDALVARGWAVDDTKEWLDCTVDEKIDRKNTRTVITWEAL